MAIYQFSFYAISQLSVVSPAGVGTANVQLTATGNTQGTGTPGEIFQTNTATPTLSRILIDDDDGFGTDSSISESGPRPVIAAGSPNGTPGAAVDIEYRISVVTDEVPPRTLTFYMVSIGGVNVGIVGPEPLIPNVEYTITSAADQQSATTLRNYSLNGSNAQVTADTAGQNSVPWDTLACFTHGTLIDTADGPRLIEELEAGDLVTTMGNGSQPLRWIGSRALSRAELLARPDWQPVLFEAGTIGNARDLLVSPQHRMLLNDWRAQVYFGEDQVLIAAKAMVNGKTIRQVAPAAGVTYCHLLFDRHEVIIAEGALSESFHPGEIGIGALDEAQRREIEALFPHLALIDRRTAFPIVRTAEAMALRLPG
jgi:hypothetical protein